MIPPSELDSPPGRWIRFWWVGLPGIAGRLSRWLLHMLADGLYLVGWRPVAALAPIVALLLGLLIGWVRLDAEVIYTQSLVIQAIALAFGFLSSLLGALFVLGYAIVDFLLPGRPGPRTFSLLDVVLLRGALLVTYLAFAVMAAIIPAATRMARASVPLPSPERADARMAAEILIAAITGPALLFLYLQAVPLLIRPLFTWQGQTPPVDAIAPLQERGWILALVALVFAILRVILEYSAAAADPAGVEALVAAVEQADRPGLLDRLPQPVTAVIWSGIATFLVAGLLDNWFSVLIIFLSILFIEGFRILLANRAPGWTRLVERVPVILRLAAVLALSALLSARLFASLRLGESFLPLVLALLIPLALMAVAFPGSTAAKGETRWPTTSGDPGS